MQSSVIADLVGWVVSDAAEAVEATKPKIISSHLLSWYVRQQHHFKIDAIVVLPEHLHSIWTLPEIEYIHYNPGHHGLVTAPKDWQYSSFHRYVEAGIYDQMWGSSERLMFRSKIGRE